MTEKKFKKGNKVRATRLANFNELKSDVFIFEGYGIRKKDGKEYGIVYIHATTPDRFNKAGDYWEYVENIEAI